jgi:uncharacterized protein YfdQ (DUF2303 family)
LSFISDEALERLTDLCAAAQKFETIIVENPAPASGLPDKIVVGFDHKTEKPVDLAAYFASWRTHPERKQGTATVSTLESFIDLVNRHKTEHSVIFAKTEWPQPSLAAVIDYHEIGDGKPSWGKHKVHYPFPVTEEFKGWIDGDAKMMTQGDFAEFVEEHAAELATPTNDEQREFEQLFQTAFATPAEMVMLSRGLQVNVNHVVKNAVKLQSGETEVVFTEEHASATGEKLVVPGIFMIQVRAFRDGNPVRIVARLRYRKSGGSLGWFYQLYRWKDRLVERVSGDLNIAATATELPAYKGTPEQG